MQHYDISARALNVAIRHMGNNDSAEPIKIYSGLNRKAKYTMHNRQKINISAVQNRQKNTFTFFFYVVKSPLFLKVRS